jgi:nicotinamidase/pyrazinamidase
MKSNHKSALLIIDVQNDFLPGGALAVPHGDRVIPEIKKLIANYDCIILTQDWHPAGHISFASTHGKEHFASIEVDYGIQRLWPDHCVQNTKGAEIVAELETIKPDLILRKGAQQEIDSYSGFIEADRKTMTALKHFLTARGVQHVSCVGLALDYCVLWTALDAVNLGFQTDVILKACKGIDHENSVALSIQKMKDSGIHIIE